MIFLHDKNQQDALFYCKFISIINLYMFRAGLLLIIKRYFLYMQHLVCVMLKIIELCKIT